jgi:glyoxylate reductase
MNQMATNRKPKVIVSRKISDSIEARMAELFDVKLNLQDKVFSKNDLIAAVQEADVFVSTVTDNITAEIINQAGPQFKMIANFGMGVDHIDMQAARAKGIVVTNTPGVLTEETADLSMALILAVPRRIFQGEKVLRAGKWDGWRPMTFLGHSIGGKRLGIIGMGRIGRAVAKRAKAFGMSVHYHNRNRLHASIESELEATYWENLDEMLTSMDVISVNCPLTNETHHLLSRDRLKLLQSHAYVINTARGEVIDEAALADLIEDKTISGAGLDVFEFEPKVNAKLLGLDNVVLIPHMGSATFEARQATGERVLINIKTFADGHTPPDKIIEDL